MKKTLTVNLGGTVFHIDEDAYQLLDKYLTNLRIHFKNKEETDEIMNDFEARISELLSERIRLGYEVITIEHIEEVIKRMGKPEDIFDDEQTKEEKEEQPTEEAYSQQATTTRRRLMRNPDDRILGGLCGGFAAYMNWDPTAVRIALFLLMFFFGVTIPLYFILWLIVPMAQTATEKLEMRGESVTIENIGKTVTNGFEKVSNKANEYINSDKPRTALQKMGRYIRGHLRLLRKVYPDSYGHHLAASHGNPAVCTGHGHLWPLGGRSRVPLSFLALRHGYDGRHAN